MATIFRRTYYLVMIPRGAVSLAILLLGLISPPLHATLTRDDLSVSWIGRTPKIDYVWNSSNPTVDGWPVEGSEVKWVAHVRWLGDQPLQGVQYRWLLDGEVVGNGSLDFPPSSIVETELPWKWTRARHQIRFELDPENRFKELEERNNSLTIDTDAIAIGLYVEPGFWESFTAQVISTHIGAVTFEDWAQKNVRRFNEMAANAIYPDSPNGVLERWRIDEVHMVEDGALPLVPPTEARDWGADPKGWGTLYPNAADHTVDIQWGFPTSTKTYYPFATPWTFTIGNSLMHEFAHCRTMIDIYAWNLAWSKDVLHMKNPPNGNDGGRIFSSPMQGMMQFDWGHIDRYTAAAMNLMHGRRATRGNYNEPWDLGWFLNDFPARNIVRFVRPDGSPLAQRTIRIFQPSGEQTRFGVDPTYRQIFDATADVTLTTNADGEVTLGRNPISSRDIIARVDQANGTAIVEIEDGTRQRWAFLESLDFNLAYWRGETEEAHYEVIADQDVCYDQLGPGAIYPQPEAVVTSRQVTFEIYGTFSHTYDLYYSIDGGATQSVAVPTVPANSPRARVTVPLPSGRVVWWFEDRSAGVGCPPQHSSIYAFDHIIAGHQRPVR
jgi:hypothetical protein